MKQDYLLHKWLNGEILTEAEMLQLKASPEFASYLKISDASATLTPPTFNQEANFKAIKNKLATKKHIPVKKLNPLTTFLKIVAVLAVLFVGYKYINSLNTTVKTEVAQTKNIQLPDESEVLVNAKSTLAFNKKTWDKKRELSLEGEAYFKVTRGKKFRVKTALGEVAVLGTQFNVYARDKKFTVVCYEGLVQVTLPDTIIKVPAGNNLRVENNKIISFKPTQIQAPLWVVQKESHFENAPLRDVIKELERQYPITVSTKSNRILDKRFTGSFTHKNLETALKTICKPLQLKFTISDNQVSIYAK